MIGSNFFILSVHLSSFYLNIVIRLSECVWRRLVPFLWSGGIKHSSLVPFFLLPSPVYTRHKLVSQQHYPSHRQFSSGHHPNKHVSKQKH